MEKPQFTLEFEKPLRALEERLGELVATSQEQKLDVSDEIAAIERKIEATKREIFSNLTAWQRIQIARHPRRPYAPDYIASIFTDFQELHGDRQYGDDQALIGGIAFFNDKPVMVISQQKGRDTRENLRRNFGMPSPEGYRKALRLMKMAEKFHLPVLAFIDTPGAFPGLESEERHVAEAIAVNLREMSHLKTPIICTILGEGGSGGALGIGVGDRILMLENAYYSVISPEGCAAILWKDRAHAPRAAEALKLDATHLLKHEVIDAIVPEPFGGAHSNPTDAAEKLKVALTQHLNELTSLEIPLLVEQRYQKFRKIGPFLEGQATPVTAKS